MPNKQRGEVSFTVAGEAYTVRPTFQMIAEIEDEIGPILELTGKVRFGSFKLSQVCRVLAIAVRRCPNKPKSEPEFVEAVFQDGVLGEPIKAASALLAAALGGDDEKKDGGEAASG